MSRFIAGLLVAIVSVGNVSECSAATTTYVICSKRSDGKITIRTRCRSGESKISNRSSLVGATGAPGSAGTDGADGVLGIYGDGSAGPLDASSGAFGTGNLQFTTCNVSLGQLLSIPSGTILRCTGAANIAGSILVNPHAHGGYVGSFASTNVYTSRGHSAAPGITRAAASNGEMGGNGSTLLGAPSSFGMGDDESRLSFRPSLYGCGGGGGSVGLGGAGGGYFAIFAQGGITISGAIGAQGGSGTSGAGGGGGGVVVFASKTSVTLASGGSIDVSGGSGGASAAGNGAGGGGAGGIVHFLAPSVTTSAGTIVAAGGSAGSEATQVSNNIAVAGGAGGHCLFSGGAGSNVPGGRPATATGAAAGNVGTSITVTTDPTALLVGG